MSWLTEQIDNFTGKTTVNRQKEAVGAAASNMAQATHDYAVSSEEAARLQEAADQRSLAERIREYQLGRSDLSGGVDRAIGALDAGERAGVGAANLEYERNMANVLAGMGIDRDTIMQLMGKYETAQQPYQDASITQLKAALPRLLGMMGMPGGEGGYTPSSLANIQLADAQRLVKAAAQKRGLGGSSMETAQNIAARGRVLGADEQLVFKRLQDMIASGMLGQQFAGAGAEKFAQQLGGLGARLSSLRAPNISDIYNKAAQGRADLYAGLGEKLATLKSGVPDAIAAAGQNQAQNILNTGKIRYDGAGLQSGYINQSGGIQAPSGLTTLGQVADIASTIGGMFKK